MGSSAQKTKTSGSSDPRSTVARTTETTLSGNSSEVMPMLHYEGFMGLNPAKYWAFAISSLFFNFSSSESLLLGPSMRHLY